MPDGTQVSVTPVHTNSAIVAITAEAGILKTVIFPVHQPVLFNYFSQVIAPHVYIDPCFAYIMADILTGGCMKLVLYFNCNLFSAAVI